MKAFLRRLFSNPLFAANLTFAVLFINAYFNLPRSRLLFILAGTWILFHLLSEPLRGRILDRLHPVLSPRAVILLFTLFLVFMFQVKFPFRDWNKTILEDDYIAGYVATVKAAESIREGGLLGWDGKIMGGYPQAVDAQLNKSMFAAPLMFLFGSTVGYHLMIFLAFMAFPFLCLLYSRILLDDRVSEAWTFAFASVFLLSFFRNFLTFGMVDALLGLDFLVLNLTLLEKVRENKGWAAFALSVSVACTLYSHIGLFFISLFFFAIELWVSRSRRIGLTVFAALSFSFFMTLHDTFYLLYYRSFFPTSPDYYDPSLLTLGVQLSENIRYFARLFDPLQIFNLRYNLENLLLAFLPILACSFLNAPPRIRRIAIYLSLIPLIRGIQIPVTTVVTSRIVFVTSFFLSVLMGDFVRRELLSRRPQVLLFLPLLFLPTLGTHTWYPMHHVGNLGEAYPSITRTIRAMDGHTIMLEVVSHLNTLAGHGDLRSESPPPGVTHWESLLSYEMPEKRFLANSCELYHFYKYRDIYINAGAWKGRPVDEYSPSEMRALLRKWGVRYLAVWSQRSGRFFVRAKEDYEWVTQDGPWTIFRFLHADLRSVALPRGEGRYEDRGRFAKRVHLSDAVRGDTAVIRENYFPSWRAFFGDMEIPVLDHEGQMAFTVPEDGTLEIEMRFPKYRVLAVLALVSLLLSFVFFVFPGFSRKIIPPDPEPARKT